MRPSNVRFSWKKILKSQLLFISMLCLTFCFGCGGQSNIESPSISFASGLMAPPASVMATATARFAATVTNDNSNLGVSWIVSCSSASASECGSIDRHTASGMPATYIAPLKVPTGGKVTVTANASANPAMSVVATFDITPIVYGPVSLAFSPALPASVSTSSSFPVSVAVTNDHYDTSGNFMGYQLALSCGAGITGNVCGRISDGTYYAPATLPPGGVISITATSNADSTKSISGNVQVISATIGVGLAQTPPANLQVGAQALVSAVTTNDQQALGIDWTVECATPPCGSFIPQHTASNVVTSFTAPAGTPSNGTVKVTAASTADPTKQASAVITITPAALRNDLLKGRYAFQLNGVNLSGNLSVMGSMIADGNGNITSAVETIAGRSSRLTGISGTYFITSDGRGTITLNGADKTMWANGQQIFSVVVVDSSYALVQEFDGVGTYSYTNSVWNITKKGSSLTGTLELQDTAAFHTPSAGSYAFVMHYYGAEIGFSSGGYYGGVLTTDSSGRITTLSMDRSLGGAIDSITETAFTDLTFAAPDAYGRGIAKIGPYSMDYYIVNSDTLLLVTTSATTLTGFPSGQMHRSQTALAPGNYAFTMAGSSPYYKSGVAKGTLPQALAGVLSFDAGGTVSGVLDANDNGTTQMAHVSGTWIASAGRVLITIIGGGGSKFALYPTSDGRLLMFQLDVGRSATGTALPQDSNISNSFALGGTYAFSSQRIGYIDLSRADVGQPAGPWDDLIGRLNADGTSSIMGEVDLDHMDGTYIGSSGNFWTLSPPSSVTGTFVLGTQGRLTGSLTVPAIATLASPIDNMPYNFYVVDSSTILTLETGPTVSTGVLKTQHLQ